jgi:hypothetical protein
VFFVQPSSSVSKFMVSVSKFGNAISVSKFTVSVSKFGNAISVSKLRFKIHSIDFRLKQKVNIVPCNSNFETDVRV